MLRPPGGVTTDIFAGEMPSTPRNGKNRMASNIFSVEKDSVKNNGKFFFSLWLCSRMIGRIGFDCVVVGW